MIKIFLLVAALFTLPSGVVVARLLWRAGNLKLKAAEKKQLREDTAEFEKLIERL